MQKMLSEFIAALRQSGLPISQAETLDAVRAVQLVGIRERQLLKTTLTLSLSKTRPNQLILEQLFDDYFAGPNTSLNDALDESDSLANATQSPPLSADDQQAAARSGSQGELSALSQQLLSGDGEGLTVAVAAAAGAENLSGINVFTQKNLYSYRIMQRLGDEALLADINSSSGSSLEPALINALQTRRQQLQAQVRDYVEQQFLVHAKHKGMKFREDLLHKVKLSHIEHQDYHRMAALVAKAAKKLATQHSRRRKVSKRGMLDVRKTLAANAAFDGVQFHTRWKATKIERPKIVAICDVSGSVSRVARFLLLFLYSLQDVLPKVRSFVFASDLVEVSELFERESVAEAMEIIMQRWGNMSTNYGTALEGLQEQVLSSIDKKTTVIMLGDARNNNGDGRADIWAQVYRQSRRVLWLNPENKVSWNTGDSIMSEYSPGCSEVDACQSLNDINRIFSRLLKHS